MQGAEVLDDEMARMLRSASATRREREWMAAALRRAADRLDDKATGIDRELDKSARRRSLPRGDDLRVGGRIDGLRSAASDLRQWAEVCKSP